MGIPQLLVAIGRDTSWRDVGIDVLGACLGMVLAQAVRESKCRAAHAHSTVDRGQFDYETQ